MNTRLNKSVIRLILVIWEHIMYGISKQYSDGTVTYHFLNVPFDLIYGKCHFFYKRTTQFLFYLCPDYC